MKETVHINIKSICTAKNYCKVKIYTKYYKKVMESCYCDTAL